MFNAREMSSLLVDPPSLGNKVISFCCCKWAEGRIEQKPERYRRLITAKMAAF